LASHSQPLTACDWAGGRQSRPLISPELDFAWRGGKVTGSQGVILKIVVARAMGRTDDQAQDLSALMRAAQAGDAQAYSSLLKILAPLVKELARQRLRFLQPQDIDDLVQDVLLSVHAARATYDPSRPFHPWLRAIVRNRIADGARRYVRRSAHEVPAERPAETFPDNDANMSAEYGDAEALAQAMARLPHSQRQAIELMKLREMSLKEASAVTGTSIGALKVSVHRGISALRKALGAAN
jgi:RNA polymerase sigma-70 factor (ECF subfamily)